MVSDNQTTERARALNDARLAAMKARFGPPSMWPRPGYPVGWHMDRPCTPEEASHHDNGCIDAARAIGALLEGATDA